LLVGLVDQTSGALDNLRELARGIYPPLLADRGLVVGLEAQARKAPVKVQVTARGVGRYSQDTEAAVYFCCLEAVQNVAKYSGATRCLIRLVEEDGRLTFSVEDDGTGFDPDATPRGSGLTNMADRMAVLGGEIEVRSRPGEGTIVTGRVPVRALEPVG
jgi:signal transduction histidine kinase